MYKWNAPPLCLWLLLFKCSVSPVNSGVFRKLKTQIFIFTTRCQSWVWCGSACHPNRSRKNHDRIRKKDDMSPLPPAAQSEARKSVKQAPPSCSVDFVWSPCNSDQVSSSRPLIFLPNQLPISMLHPFFCGIKLKTN